MIEYFITKSSWSMILEQPCKRNLDIIMSYPDHQDPDPDMTHSQHWDHKPLPTAQTFSQILTRDTRDTQIGACCHHSAWVNLNFFIPNDLIGSFAFFNSLVMLQSTNIIHRFTSFLVVWCDYRRLHFTMWIMELQDSVVSRKLIPSRTRERRRGKVSGILSPDSGWCLWGLT